MEGSATQARQDGRSLSGTLLGLGTRAAKVCARREWACVAAVLGVFLTVTLWHAAIRPLWYDECLTLVISRLPTLHAISRAMPADGQPPMQYLLAHLSLTLFGTSEVALRLPETLAFAGAALGVYLFVRRRSAPAFAFLAMATLIGSGMRYYAYEARPYSLLLFFTALTLVSWQAAAEGRLRPLSLAGVAVGIAGAITSHHFGALYAGMLLGSGEAVRLWKRRRPDYGMYIAAAVGFSALAVTLPLIRLTERLLFAAIPGSAAFWAKPRLFDLGWYADMVPVALPAAFAVLAAAMLPALGKNEGSPRKRDVPPAPLHETCAAAALVLLAPVVLILSRLTTEYAMERYAAGAALGIAVLVGIAVPRLGPEDRFLAPVAALCAVAVLVCAVLGNEAIALRKNRYLTRVDPLARTAPGSGPIVVASALHYLELWNYAPADLRARLVYLADRDYAERQSDFLPELSLDVGRSYFGQIEDYRTFLAAHPRFLFYCGDDPRLEWTRGRLLGAGWKLRLLRDSDAWQLYEAEEPVTAASRQ